MDIWYAKQNAAFEVRIRAWDYTADAPKTGLTSITVYYTKGDGTSASVALTTAGGTLVEVDSTNKKGTYRLLFTSAYSDVLKLLDGHCTWAGATEKDAYDFLVWVGIRDVDEVYAAMALDSTVAKDATVSKDATVAKDSTVAKDATVAKEATTEAARVAAVSADGKLPAGGAAAATAYTSGRAALLDNLDALVSSRAATGAAMALTSGERATLAGVLWDEALPGLHAGGTAGERLATTDDRVDAVVSTVKAKTDLIPAVPAAVGDVTAARDAVITALPVAPDNAGITNAAAQATTAATKATSADNKLTTVQSDIASIKTDGALSPKAPDQA